MRANWRIFADSGEPTPLLATGYHLTVEEFHQRYEKTAEDVRAQLIDGVVYMSPFNTAHHAEKHGQLLGLCGYYTMQTPFVIGSAPATIRIDDQNEFEPDGFIYLELEHGGGVKPYHGNCLQGAPELVIEIAPFRIGMEMHEKFKAYERAGVLEYVVWNLEEEEISVFHRNSEKFCPAKIDNSDVVRSQCFPGLWLNLGALIAGNKPVAKQTMDEGLNSDEHRQFVKRLQGGGK